MANDQNTKRTVITEGTTIKGGVIPTTNSGQRPAPPSPQQPTQNQGSSGNSGAKSKNE